MSVRSSNRPLRPPGIGRGAARWVVSACCAVLACGAQVAQAGAAAPTAARDGAAPAAWAVPGGDAAGAALARIARDWTQLALQRSPAASNQGLRLEVEVGSLDRRLTLAACAQVEPYLPPGVALWGKARVGLRCVQGEGKWNVFLPVTVRAMGPTWVLKTQVMPGAVLSEADVLQAEGDWAEFSSPVLSDPKDWLGKTTARMLMAGQVLRQDMVRPTQVFAAGAQVRVVAVGPGFEIATDAQALQPGVVGQPARVRMDNGRVVQGWVLDERTVRVQL